ncbi:hypothetical protein SAMN05216357_11040 [Porphyromonadaceae bacterium KH3CP3RA]|nr:hypothetical protein SAMN05216357_11040 [Porphyromonadaceae bacterium KH3CP3RA]
MVVSDKRVRNSNFPTPPNPEYSTDEYKDEYGGYLICESIGNRDDAQLITAAPEMLEALQSIVGYWNTPQKGSLHQHLMHSLDLAQKAIDKALGKQ